MVALMKHLSGFTLVELTVVLTILGLLAAGGLAVSASMIEKANYVDTRKQLAIINETLENYYTVNGRLPCPASLDAIPGSTGFGTEAIADCATNTAVPSGTFRDNAAEVRIGMVPVRALGLTDTAAQDKFGARILYAVTEKLTSTSDFAATSGAITMRAAADSTTLTTEAAYTLLSHGKDRRGAVIYLTGNPASPDCADGSSQRDIENCDNNATFRDAPFNNGSETANWFDDIIVWTPKFHLAALAGTSSSFWASNVQDIYTVGSDGTPSTGNVGIGTDSPLRKLHVVGGALMEANNNHYLTLSNPYAAANTRNWVWEDSANSGKLLLRSYLDNGLAKADIFSADHATGNVGIGTAMPEEKLHIIGNGKISGYMQFPTMQMGNSGATDADIAFNQTGALSAEDNLMFLLNADNSGTGTSYWMRNGNNTSNATAFASLTSDSNFSLGLDGAESAINGSASAGGSLTVNAAQNWDNGAAIQLYGRTHSGTPGAIYYYASMGNSFTTLAHSFRRRNGGSTTTLFSIRANGNAVLTGILDLLSDARLKQNITEIKDPLARVLQMRGVNFNWSSNTAHDPARLQLGVIAQEVQKPFPELVELTDEGYLSVNYSGISAALIEAVRELDQKNNTLTQQMEQQKKDIAELKTQLGAQSPFSSLWLIYGNLAFLVLLSGCVALLWRRQCRCFTAVVK